MDDYKTYLAQQVLTEDKLVTYRLLSRALKVHVNTAKEMLYDFHKSQNDKKPGTIHATYLVYGTRKNEDDHDGDVDMGNSQMSEDNNEDPFKDQVSTQTLALVKEEQLQDTLALYDRVISIHVYSLAPHPLKDLQLLVDTARQVAELVPADDASVANKAYGTITNPGLRKKERRGPGPKAAPKAAQPKAEPKPQIKQESKPSASSSTVKEEPKPAPIDTKPSVPTAAPSVAKKSSAAPSLKRQGSSGGIGQMFAKQAAKPKPAPKPPVEDTAMALSDEGEDDEEPAPEPKQEESSSGRVTRKDRQAELRRMMEESDEEEEEKKEKEETPDEGDAMDEDEPEPAEPEKKEEPKPSEEVTSTGNGRRRGRRRVTRKKQVMDEQGYLVTRQEEAWESFSEDEAKPSAPLAQRSKPQAAPAAGAKAKKPAAKGQGNIMSFFSKK